MSTCLTCSATLLFGLVLLLLFTQTIIFISPVDPITLSVASALMRFNSVFRLKVRPSGLALFVAPLLSTDLLTAAVFCWYFNNKKGQPAKPESWWMSCKSGSVSTLTWPWHKSSLTQGFYTCSTDDQYVYTTNIIMCGAAFRCLGFLCILSRICWRRHFEVKLSTCMSGLLRVQSLFVFKRLFREACVVSSRSLWPGLQFKRLQNCVLRNGP